MEEERGVWGVYVGPSARHRVGAISMFSHFRIPNEAPERIAASPSLLATLLVDHIELHLVLVPTE
jgi:hypothetical protein